jgi:hypothetical protein
MTPQTKEGKLEISSQASPPEERKINKQLCLDPKVRKASNKTMGYLN